MSTKNAGLAKKMGYKNIKVMLKGVPGWKKSRGYVVASDTFVKKGNIVLIDTRSKEEYEKGHVARAVNIPMNQFSYDTDEILPQNQSAPIVVYGKGDDSRKAYNVVKSMKRKTGAVMASSLDEWVAKGNKLVPGPSPKEIVWKRILGKGEIGLKEFNSIVSKLPQEKLIVDVRTKGEVKEGMYSGAKSIPLDEIQTRISELPKEKELIIHCTTGARAEMAYQELIKSGFKVRYLVANVECDDDGCEAEG